MCGHDVLIERFFLFINIFPITVYRFAACQVVISITGLIGWMYFICNFTSMMIIVISFTTYTATSLTYAKFICLYLCINFALLGHHTNRSVCVLHL